MERFGSLMDLERDVGDPCFMESSEVAGDTPSDMCERRLKGLKKRVS
jgi:hypothetical protein